MKFFLLLASVTLAAAQGLPPLVGPLVPDNTNAITGVVRRADTGQGISQAQVVATGIGQSVDEALARASVTDASGKFTIRNLNSGDYTITVQAEGYFNQTNDGSISPRVSKDITIFEALAPPSVALELMPGATISGRIRDDSGQLLTGVTVEALQAVYVNGRLGFTPVKSVETDDLGEYRLFWIPAGNYYVRAQYRRPGADHTLRYEAVFFPGVSEADLAPTIRVGAASESAIDLRIPTKPLNGLTVSGRVTQGDDLAGMAVRSVYVVPRERTVTLTTDVADAFQNEAADPSNGAFEIHGVLPGAYNLFPVVADDTGALVAARISVDVEDRSIEGLSGVLSAVTELAGRVRLDGKTPSGRLLTGHVILTSRDGLPGGVLDPSRASADGSEASTSAALDSKTGEFLIPHVAGGKYVLGFAPLDSGDVYIDDVRQGDKSVFDSGFLVGDEKPQPFEVVLKSNGATLSGTVYDSTRVRPFANATVVLVPASARRQNPFLYRTARSAANGAFSLVGVAPGNYKLFAWESVVPGAWQNPSFLGGHEDRGIPVRVSENPPVPVSIEVIRR